MRIAVLWVLTLGSLCGRVSADIPFTPDEVQRVEIDWTGDSGKSLSIFAVCICRLVMINIDLSKTAQFAHWKSETTSGDKFFLTIFFPTKFFSNKIFLRIFSQTEFCLGLHTAVVVNCKLNDCNQNTTAVCGNIATVGYNYIRANSDHLHVQGELFGQTRTHHVNTPQLVFFIHRNITTHVKLTFESFLFNRSF